MMKKKAMTNKAAMPVVPQGFKNGGKVKVGAGKESRGEEMAEARAIQAGKLTPAQYADMEAKEPGYKNGGKVAKCADGGLVWDRTQGTGVRSQQDYRK